MTGTVAPAPRSSVWPLAAIALAGPALIGTGLVLIVASSEMSGRTPLSVVPANVAEAAAMGNAAETVWFLQQGRDPRRIEDVRPEIISPDITRVNALEAAVWSRQPELVTLLDRWGAIGADVRSELICLAEDLDADDIVESLRPTAAPACDAGTTAERVAARAAGAGGR